MTSDGVCYHTKKVNGKDVRSKTCCSNFYKSSDGNCLVCPVGSYGKNCSFNCIAPFYGKLCTSKCECNSFSSNYEETTKEWHKEIILTEATKELNKEIIFTEITKEWNKEVTSVKYEKDVKESAVTLDQVIKIIVATSASTAVSLVIVCFCVLIIKRLMCKKHRIIRGATFNEGISNNGEINALPSTLQEQLCTVNINDIPDSQYETIDESIMIEILNVRIDEERLDSRNSHTSSSSSDSKTSSASGIGSEDTEGYLHPYNTLDENWQNKGYQYSSCIAKAYTSKIPKQKLTVEENSAKNVTFHAVKIGIADLSN
ncbi:unnamed protein product [Mytilus edulis]|uniref:MEGF10_11 n=1 Tax=Mytilus edulis TaxID=6550 RepID=A0A8S3RPD5_MYTED|nr:unnamed protein product [Mytilus edulis]